MKIIGLIINPIAGMGGRVGLKGTDSVEILNKAIQLGASLEAPNKTLAAMGKLEPIREELLVLTASGDMGENQCRTLGFQFEIIHKINETSGGIYTHRSDTIKAASVMEQRGAELIFFAGGDGTARDICRAVGTRVPVLGIPAGVKIYSPVYGNTPQAAGELAFLYLKNGNLPLKEEEVVDLNEEAVRKNRVRTEVFGYLKVPYQKKYLQNKKAPTPLDEEESRKSIALDVIDHMQGGEYYLIGPGTTAGAVMEALELPNTLLGVDVIRDKRIVKSDCSEKELLQLLDLSAGRSAKLIIAPTGGQGYLLGRGNQQISPEVLRKIGKENIMIVSVNSKIIGLGGSPLLIDTGDETMNQYLEGYYRIKVGYDSEIIYRVSAG